MGFMGMIRKFMGFFYLDNLIGGTILLIVLLAALPFVIKLVFPQIDLVYKVVLIFAIYQFVTQMLQNNSTLSLLITGIMVYFMVFKYGDIFTSLWFLSIIFTYLGGTILVTSGGEEHGGHAGHPPR
jgi:hypothetical protein